MPTHCESVRVLSSARAFTARRRDGAPPFVICSFVRRPCSSRDLLEIAIGRVALLALLALVVGVNVLGHLPYLEDVILGDAGDDPTVVGVHEKSDTCMQ